MILLVSSLCAAGDFDWMKNFNIQARADDSGFKARLETRFKIGDLEIDAVLGNVDNPSDAYMLLRLGEMSGQPMERVIGQYKAQKGNGWGKFAKSLGIKPGSREFHALKQGQDLYGDREKGKERSKHKNKGKGRK